MIGKFIGWIEGFPTETEKAEEVVKNKTKQNKTTPASWNYYEIWSAQVTKSDNGTSFTSKVTQGVSKALGITYYLHCTWRSQSSGKVQRAHQFLTSVIKKKVNPEDRPGVEGGFTSSSPPHPYWP